MAKETKKQSPTAVKAVDKKEELKNLLEELMKLMNVSGTVDATEGEDGPRDGEASAVSLTIKSEDSALLIGYHGKTIGALQTILGVVAYEKWGRVNVGEKVPVLVDVDGWRQRREETVVSIAKSTAERVKTTGEPAPIYNLSPFERRVAHMALAEDPDVVTESEGEGKDRHLVVKPKIVISD
ncbi:KH domain-containing protein [Candidatus Microgenomates bacterium]|nr:KH domain-containing protein [Candidatus Microgenomates bacterium]